MSSVPHHERIRRSECAHQERMRQWFHQCETGAGTKDAGHFVSIVQDCQHDRALMRGHLTWLLDQFQGCGWVCKVNYDGFEFRMAELAGCGGNVGGDLHMHRHLRHEVAKSMDGPNVIAHK